jgi:hypothetical protein
MMKRFLLGLALLVGFASPSFAVCAVTNLQVKDNVGTTALAPYADDGSGGSNCSPQIQIKQGGQVAAVVGNSASGVATAATNLATVAYSYAFNGATWDRLTSSSGSLNVVGTVNPTTAANWGIGATGAAVPANGQYASVNIAGNLVGATGLALGATTKAPTVAIVDGSGNQITAFGGSGGTASNFGSAFPTAGTAIGLTSGTNMIAWSATTNYGTAPAAIPVPAVNANVTNANANGRATSANSSPVVPSASPSTWHLIAAASTNATSVKASAATVFSCQLSGIGSTPAYLKIYNKASAPTVGTDVPVKTLIIPAAATAANGAGSNIQFGPGGMALGTGFATAVTGGIADADATAVAATTFALNCDYE